MEKETAPAITGRKSSEITSTKSTGAKRPKVPKSKKDRVKLKILTEVLSHIAEMPRQRRARNYAKSALLFLQNLK